MEKRGEGAASVPYIAYESANARHEREKVRLWILAIILALMLFGSNAAWLAAWNSYDFESYAYTQDGEGINIIGDGNGVDYNGTEGARAQTD